MGCVLGTDMDLEVRVANFEWKDTETQQKEWLWVFGNEKSKMELFLNKLLFKGRSHLTKKRACTSENRGNDLQEKCNNKNPKSPEHFT